MGSNDHYPVDDPKPLGLDGMLSAIKARCDAATPGPLVVWPTLTLLSIRGSAGWRNGRHYRDGPVLCRARLCVNPEAPSVTQARADMHFFANSRTDIPRLMLALEVAMNYVKLMSRCDADSELIRFRVARILAGEEAESDDS